MSGILNDSVFSLIIVFNLSKAACNINTGLKIITIFFFWNFFYFNLMFVQLDQKDNKMAETEGYKGVVAVAW